MARKSPKKKKSTKVSYKINNANFIANQLYPVSFSGVQN